MSTSSFSRRSSLRWLAGAGGAAAAITLLGEPLIAQRAVAQQAVPGIFGSVEVPNKGLQPFPQWAGALQRFFEEAGKAQQGCTPSATNKCHYATWAKLITDSKAKDIGAQIQGVNDFMNQAPYVVDMINWGVNDYWSSPGQFFEKFGDCEDYAIAKFLTLRALGVPSANMRIVALTDLNLKVAHAIAAVYISGKILVMDNQIKPVVDSTTIKHYLPLYSVNEEGWWLHRPA